MPSVEPPAAAPGGPPAGAGPRPAARGRKPGERRRSRRVAGKIAVVALKTVFATLVILTPLLGAWTASSLAAYANGPVWLVALTGLLLFPILPGAWEALAEVRHRRKKDAKPRSLTRGDRLLLRTLTLNVAFLGSLWLSGPRAAFRALEARGDWMLDGVHGSAADGVRRFLFGVADALEFAYGKGEGEVDPSKAQPDRSDDGEPPPLPRGDRVTTVDPTQPPSAPAGSTTPTPPPPLPPLPAPAEPGKLWPSAPSPHPLVAELPAEAAGSIAALGAFAHAEEPDPYQRFKLLHDWVALHVAYDVAALGTAPRPPQDAESVFRTGKAVCAGYAALLEALGKAAGFDVAFVGGVAKGAGGEVDGRGHAWNAVTIEGKPYLVDATWDAGVVGASEDDPSPHFQARFRTDYLFTPPEVFLREHFPEEARWQLLDTPVDRGEFMRLPQLGPRFFAAGLRLVSPERSQVTVTGAVDAVVERPTGVYLLARTYDEAGASAGCDPPSGDLRLTLHCPLARPGKHRLVLFASAVEYGTYQSIGELSVLSR